MTTIPSGRGREVTAIVTAEIVHDSFDRFYAEFHRITRDARHRFDMREWMLVHDLHHQRIDLYQRYVTVTLGRLASTLRAFPEDVQVWRGAHRAYADLVRGRTDFEVAETFFNAITRKVFRTVGVNREIEFLERELETPDSEPLPGQIERVPTAPLVEMFATLLVQPRPAIHWRDLRRDAAWLGARYEEHCEAMGVLPTLDAIDVLRPLFFRTREGYIVARGHAGDRQFPLLVPIQPTAGGMVVDGALFDEASTLQVFSSTRSYFFVDVIRPVDVVDFLGSLMPRLTQSELYIAIAHHRHGKTLIHRELIDYLGGTSADDDPFIMAPGIAGLVMTVFTLPSYRNVFKVIRDKFDKPTATREGILRSYRDVFRGRRVGRLADTQEFEYLAFDRRRFSEPCLRELIAKAQGSILVEDDEVVVSHLYIEEKMTPLNIYLAQVGPAEAAAAMIDYGDAIAELAANNIFAGDLLWKNFGVTGNGRLVLYDYDEICPLLACNFRLIPKPRSYEDELSDQPYYAVADSDVFPQEWAPFIVPREPALRAAFLDHHAALLTPEFWQDKQAHVVANELNIGLPYAPRFPALSSPPPRV